MDSSILIYFIAGGVSVSAGVLLANSGNTLLSGLAIMFPAITVSTYYFVGRAAGSEVVAESIKSTLASAIIVWLPYMFVLLYLTPKLGVNKAMFFSVITYLIIGAAWLTINSKYKLI